VGVIEYTEQLTYLLFLTVPAAFAAVAIRSSKCMISPLMKPRRYLSSQVRQ